MPINVRELQECQQRYACAVFSYLDLPFDGYSWIHDGAHWSQSGCADAMIRAIVADSLSTAVAPATWGVLKARHR